MLFLKWTLLSAKKVYMRYRKHSYRKPSSLLRQAKELK